MDYYVLVNNKEYGPVGELSLESWVEEGRILPNTLIKEEFSGETCNAESLAFLSEAFIVQESCFKQKFKDKNPVSKLSNAVESKGKARFFSSHAPVGLDDCVISFSTRSKAAFFDIFILLILNIVLFFGVNFLLKNHVAFLNVLLYAFIMIVFSLSIMFFVFQISFFKRTLGMRIVNIRMIRTSDNSENIFLLRAFFYILAMFVFSIVNFFLILIFGKKRLLQDLITDITVVRNCSL
jgi:uncharacterized RDD family membrane protein YckC